MNRISSTAPRATPGSTLPVPAAAKQQVRQDPATPADTFVPAAAQKQTAAASSPAQQARAIVTAEYANVLGRAPDAGGFDYWVGQVQGRLTQGQSRSDVQSWLDGQFKASPEYRHNQAGEIVNQSFQELLGRPDTNKGDWWHQTVNRMSDEGKSLDEIRRYVRNGIQDSPEYRHNQAGEIVNQSFQELLGRPDTDKNDWWHKTVSGMVDQGKSLDDIRSFVRNGIQGSPEYRHNQAAEIVNQQFQELLGRPDTNPNDWWHKTVSGLVDQGKSLDDIRGFVRAGIRGSDEFRLNHPDQMINDRYQALLGRNADGDGMAHFKALVDKLRGQGKSANQIQDAIDKEITGSPEYRQKHAPSGGRYDGRSAQPGTTNLNGAAYTNPPYTNDASNRSPGNYADAINQFGVASNPRYTQNRQGMDETYCNIFMWDVTRAMGAEIPHWTDGAGDILPPGQGYELDANGVAGWLNAHGSQNGWHQVSAQEAQAWANDGKPAVFAWNNPSGIGHVGVVRPGTFTNLGPEIAQAGSWNVNDTHVGNIFNSYNTPTYWVHD